jgi:hypothetical protein
MIDLKKTCAVVAFRLGLGLESGLELDFKARVS